MGSRKSAWGRVAVCAMASICLVRCANNESSAPISSVGNSKNAGGYSISNASIGKRSPQFSQSRIVVSCGEHEHGQLNISPQGNIIYNRSYNNIQKGSYSGETYQVKRGDTMFYIAWITGDDYRNLAQRNKIPKPYSLNIGQTLQITNGTVPINRNMPTETILASDANQRNIIGVVVTPVFTSNTQLIESRVNSRKENAYHETLSKKSLEKILPSTDISVTTNAPVIAPSKVISGWRWPTDGKVIENFSTAEGGNKGVDISGSKGQAILATANGKVVYAGNALQGYGNLIIIKHNNDYLSAYAHNNTMLVRDKQEIRAGQKIATMGSTGTSTTRLHFEIRHKGKSVNPLLYLPQR
ncbi:MAG: murein hydrolase activator NlpD [Sodalis sp. (in: enterobacteria)]